MGRSIGASGLPPRWSSRDDHLPMILLLRSPGSAPRATAPCLCSRGYHGLAMIMWLRCSFPVRHGPRSTLPTKRTRKRTVIVT